MRCNHCQPLPETSLDLLGHLLPWNVGGTVLERRELALELLPVLLRHEPDVEERHHLADLHRGALHRAERGDDLLGRLDVAALQGSLGSLLGAAAYHWINLAAIWFAAGAALAFGALLAATIHR